MRLRVEKTIKTFYTCVLNEEDSQRVVDNANEKGLSYEDSLQDLVDNDPDFVAPYMHEIDEDEWFNYVDEEYEPKGEN
jgi:hypothetical protein